MLELDTFVGVWEHHRQQVTKPWNLRWSQNSTSGVRHLCWSLGASPLTGNSAWVRNLCWNLGALPVSVQNLIERAFLLQKLQSVGRVTQYWIVRPVVLIGPVVNIGRSDLVIPGEPDITVKYLMYWHYCLRELLTLFYTGGLGIVVWHVVMVPHHTGFPFTFLNRYDNLTILELSSKWVKVMLPYKVGEACNGRWGQFDDL